MTICIDVRSHGPTGIGTYAKSLVRTLVNIDGENEYLIVTDQRSRGWSEFGAQEIVLPTANPLYWILWSNTVLPVVIAKRKVRIYHSVKHVTALRSGARQVLTVHGCPAVYRYPHLYKLHDRIYWRSVLRIAAWFYDRTITTTEFEKRALASMAPIPDSKLRAINLACDTRFKALDAGNIPMVVKRRLDLPNHFILFVGMLHPLKNVEGVLKAFSMARPDLEEQHKLLIVGGARGSYGARMKQLASDLRIMDEVIFLGHTSAEDLPYIYNLACLFLLPSYYENFGMVLLEAMACGCPVITSDIVDIDEVVGTAALRVNPTDVAAIAGGICDVLSNKERRLDLIEKGIERTRLFSWERCAKETMSVYGELVHHQGGVS